MSLIQLMREKAEAVQATVVEIGSMEEAYAYTADLCATKDLCKLLVPGATHQYGESKVVAAPALSEEQFAAFTTIAQEKGFVLLKDGLRDHLAGIDIGFTVADGAIANSGTLLQGSSSEQVRIATMVSEIHVAVLPKSAIVEDSYDIADKLGEMMGTTAYTAFITGPSRTADIERTLALGAHGPLELHILMLED